MPKSLERDLGLFSVLAISIGAMIGSGIFILPALAVDVAGPAVVLAYVLAGLLVVPAAVSKSEMATAMPEAGGTYLYIERGMGPLLGTVAGVGTWFALSFKGGLALVGGVPYLLYAFDVPPSVTTPVALGLASLLVVVNLLGSKTTGQLQVVIVAVMLVALGWFVVGGVPTVRATNYDNFFRMGVGGILEATGLVFVSYAGVTKVASIAEEIENPGRIIPLGILGSLAFTTLLYALIVVVMLGVTDQGVLAETEVPMAIAAEAAVGGAGVVAVVVAALLALVSTANAGILSSSRYPFAMSRDGLVPESLGTISDRFGTPSTSITLTGVVLLLLIAFVPIGDIAKLASAFQILVFVLINVALVAFRRGTAEYEPEFRSPAYPWIQAFGVVGGLVLLTQMGTLPLVGAVVMTVAGIAWYLWYARDRVDREGAAVDAVRRELGRQAVERTRDAVDPSAGGYETLVAVPEDLDPSDERALVAVAADLAAPQHGRVSVVRFDEVADQVPLEAAADDRSSGDLEFEERTDSIAADLDVPVRVAEIVSHDTRRALANYVEETDVDMLVMSTPGGGLRERLFSSDVDWVLTHTDCDAVLVEDHGGDFDDVDVVSVVTGGGPYDPAKIAVADAVATAHGAALRLEYGVDGTASEEQRRTIADYHEEVASLVSAPVHTEFGIPNGGTAGAGDGVTAGVGDGGPAGAGDGETDVLVVGNDNRAMATVVDCPALVVRPREETTPGPVTRTLERWLL